MLKRGFDIISSIIGLLLLSPLFLLITILIKLFSPGNIIFCQERTGRYGKSFILYKFRTMIDNPSKNSISVKGDARITALGSRLRKYKLDELPELWNILKGDMSFVGPRPEMKAYTNKLKRDEKLILELRPGLTSPATLKYFREEELLASVANAQEYNDEILWPDKIIINLDYYRNRSFFGDISLIMKTIFRLISKH